MLSDQLIKKMSPANLRFERFVSGLCPASLTPWLPLLHFSVSGFMMHCRSGLKQDRVEWVSLLGSPLEVEMFAFDVGVYGCWLLVV